MIAVGDDAHPSFAFPLVTTTQHGGTASPLSQQFCQEDDHRSLPSASRRDVPDAHDRTGQPPHPKKADVVEDISQPHGAAVDQSKGVKEGVEGIREIRLPVEVPGFRHESFHGRHRASVRRCASTPFIALSLNCILYNL